MPNNEQELQRNITSHISSLIMMTCSALHVLLKFMEMKGIADGKELTFESVRLLKEIGDKSGLS